MDAVLDSLCDTARDAPPYPLAHKEVYALQQKESAHSNESDCLNMLYYIEGREPLHNKWTGLTVKASVPKELWLLQ